MAKRREPTTLTLVRRVIESRMDELGKQIADRMSVQLRRDRTALVGVLGGQLAVLYAMHWAIEEAQHAGATKLEPGLRDGLLEALNLPANYSVRANGTAQPLTSYATFDKKTAGEMRRLLAA